MGFEGYYEPGSMTADNALVTFRIVSVSPEVFEAKLLWKRNKGEQETLLPWTLVPSVLDALGGGELDTHKQYPCRAVIRVATGEIIGIGNFLEDKYVFW